MLRDNPEMSEDEIERSVALMALEYSELRFLSGQKTDHAPGTEANMMAIQTARAVTGRAAVMAEPPMKKARHRASLFRGRQR